MIDVNVAGLTGMLAQFLPPMCERGHGRVLNVASIAAFQPIPSLATYAATKAYVLSLTESLAELRMPRLAKLPGFLIGDAEVVAAEGYRACMQGVVIKVPGIVNLAATLASRATPKWLLRRIAGTLARQRYSTQSDSRYVHCGRSTCATRERQTSATSQRWSSPRSRHRSGHSVKRPSLGNEAKSLATLRGNPPSERAHVVFCQFVEPTYPPR